MFHQKLKIHVNVVCDFLTKKRHASAQHIYDLSANLGVHSTNIVVTLNRESIKIIKLI